MYQAKKFTWLKRLNKRRKEMGEKKQKWALLHNVENSTGVILQYCFLLIRMNEKNILPILWN